MSSRNFARIGLVVAALLGTEASACAQPVQEWVNKISLSGPGVFNAVAIHSGGDPIVTGGAQTKGGDAAFFTQRITTATGSTRWAIGYVHTPGATVSEAVDIVIDSADNVIIAGFASAAGGGNDCVIIKYLGSTVAQLWVASIPAGPGGETHPWALAVDSSGDVYVTGYFLDALGDEHFFTAAFDGATGTQRWLNDHPKLGVSWGWDVVWFSGSVYVTGHDDSSGSPDFYTVKYDAATGMVLWERTWDAPGSGRDRGMGIVVDSVGNAYTSGVGVDVGKLGNDCVLIKYSATGTREWVNYYSSPLDYNDVIVEIGIYEARGVTTVYACGTHTGRADALLLSIDGVTGVTNWMGTYDTGGWENFTDLIIDSSGNIYAAGKILPRACIPFLNSDTLTVKFNALGVVQWVGVYTAGSCVYDRPQDIAIDNATPVNIFTTGFNEPDGVSDGMTIKYSQ